MAGEMKASPRFGPMGLFADVLKSAQSGMNQVDLPYLGPLGNIVLGGAPQLADDISYQGLSGLMRGGNVATGGIGTYGLKPEAVDLAGVVTGLGGLARPAANAAGRAMLPAAREFVEQVGARNMSGMPGVRWQVGSVGTPEEKAKLLKNLRIGWHTSPGPIEKITDKGKFGDVLFFSPNEPYSMGPTKKTYAAEFDERKIIDVDDLEDQQGIGQISKMLDIDEDDAFDLLTARKSVWDMGIDPEIAAEYDWEIQKIQAQSAKREGYEVARARDEQGSVYMVPMLGKETKLLDIGSDYWEDFKEKIYKKYR